MPSNGRAIERLLTTEERAALQTGAIALDLDLKQFFCTWAKRVSMFIFNCLADVLLPKLSWAEKIVGRLLVYLVLMAIFRGASKREMSQATLFDFLIILLISNVVQNAMIGDDNSVLGATTGAITLVVLSTWLNRATTHSKRTCVLLEVRRSAAR